MNGLKKSSGNLRGELTKGGKKMKTRESMPRRCGDVGWRSSVTQTGLVFGISLHAENR